jgi:thioesterase domain-containing protein
MPIQTSGSRPPFFFVHGELSNALLPSYLGPDQPFYGLEHQSQDGKPALHTRVETIAAHYLEEIREVQPHGPYFLGGYSFGGTVAFEISQQLTRRNAEVACLFMLDSGFPEIWSLSAPRKDPAQEHPSGIPLRAKLTRHLQSLGALGFQDKLSYLLSKVKGKIERTPIWLRKSVCNAHIAVGLPIPRPLRSRYILEIYDDARNAYSPEPYGGRVVYIKTKERPPYHYRHWASLIRGGMTLYEIPGEHSAIRQEPYVRLWAGILKTCLTEAHYALAHRRSNQG